MKMPALIGLLLVAAVLSLTIGARTLPLGAIWGAVTAFDPANPDHLTLFALRLPRLCAGLIAGGALGMAGALMQALTRNP
uniref:iron chelate uptake ABC transporter family permease subunit n=1 Tax=Paracoccus sp. TaxID=267 RepID=UPI0028AA32B5